MKLVYAVLLGVLATSAQAHAQTIVTEKIAGRLPTSNLNPPAGYYYQFLSGGPIYINGATLAVSWLSGFIPVHGDRFAIYVSATIGGTGFANVPYTDNTVNAVLNGSIENYPVYPGTKAYYLTVSRDHAEVKTHASWVPRVNECAPYASNAIAYSRTGALKNLTEAHTIALSVTQGSATFYSNSTCTTAITSRVIALGTSTSPAIYVKPGATGALTIKATDTTVTNKLDPATTTYSVSP